MQETSDGEAADCHQKHDKARHLERDNRLEFTTGTGLAHRIFKEHRQRNALHERVNDSDYPYPRPRAAILRPVPQEYGQNTNDPALDGDESYRIFKTACSRQRQIGDQEQGQDYFRKRKHGFQIRLKNIRK